MPSLNCTWLILDRLLKILVANLNRKILMATEITAPIMAPRVLPIMVAPDSPPLPITASSTDKPAVINPAIAIMRAQVAAVARNSSQRLLC